MFYLTTHSTHFIYGYMASDIWVRTILIVTKETRCRHIGYSFRLTAPSHRQDSTYHGLCYTNRGALAGTRNSSMGSPHEGSHHERTLLPRSYISLLLFSLVSCCRVLQSGKTPMFFSLSLSLSLSLELSVNKNHSPTSRTL